jgi:transforming growth factor-beta-induced protein
MRAFALLSLLSLASQGGLANLVTENIVQLAQANPQLSTFVSAIMAAGLADTLTGKGPFTLFAPTNRALERIESKALKALLANKADLNLVLEYHVLPSNLSMRSLMAMNVAKTLQGESVEVSDPASSTMEVNDATVLTADLLASNGIVHVIDDLLMPPPFRRLPNKVDIVHVAKRNAQLSTFVAAIAAGKLATKLEGTGSFTVFAPTNAAFARISTDKLEKLLGNQALLDQLLEYHVLRSRFVMQGLREKATRMLSTIASDTVILRKSGGATKVNNAHVATEGMEASNGIAHVVDEVLVPPNFPIALHSEDIVELIERQPDLSTLMQALVNGKLRARLSAGGPHTLFAPTNEAFAKMPAAQLKQLLARPKRLDAILEYHILAGSLNMWDLQLVRSATTAQGGVVTIGGSTNNALVNNARVLKGDIATRNGVVHFIDAVLMPPEEPLVV